MSATVCDCTAACSSGCAALAEKLFWSVLEHLRGLHAGFAGGRQGRGLARRFRRVISVVDSTTIQLVASCMDWVQHRRCKAAAKCHLRLALSYRMRPLGQA